jgi:predicted DNA-binding transcriptional regulator AlpA
MSHTHLVRFHDLKARGIVRNRVTLQAWIRKQRFPPGRWLGPNTKAWTETEIDEWLRSRPTHNATEEKDS